jgi:hypothetical protein
MRDIDYSSRRERVHDLPREVISKTSTEFLEEEGDKSC